MAMSLINITNSFSSALSNNTKIFALEKTLLQGLQDFKELLSEIQQLHIESDNYKTLFIKQKRKCESNSCSSSEELMKIVESKNLIIQSVACTLTRLNETKDLKILDEVFKILFGEVATPPFYQENNKCKDSQTISSPKSVKKELHSSNEDVSFREESISEIEGTPTGRTSPIIQMKNLKSSLIISSDFRDKKKCPDIWPTPEKKALKLSFSTPTRGKQSGKLRQARLNVVKVKESNFIDITSSPEFSGGCRSSRNENDSNIQPIIKKESIENEDTILPSPTSGPTNFTFFKSNASPMKFKKPQLSLKIKTENNNKTPKKLPQTTNKSLIKLEQNSDNKLISDIKIDNSDTFTAEDSINILNPNRLPNNFIKRTPVKQDPNNDETYCDTQASISLLHRVEKLEVRKDDNECSPSKRPLVENINVINVPDGDHIQPSMSVLQREPKLNKLAVENVKRNLSELGEVIYNEPTVRKKAEKRMLPGWSCEKCRDFFGELHKDDPEMLAKKINQCSHHRGIHNPTDRPKTPPGYWNPRWEVPENTEEFNRKNNVL